MDWQKLTITVLIIGISWLNRYFTGRRKGFAETNKVLKSYERYVKKVSKWMGVKGRSK